MRGGTELKPCDEAKYLGCSMHDRADGTKDIKNMITERMANPEKLDLYWGHSDASKRNSILVADAVSNAKFRYGLESLMLPQPALKTLDVFQLKGLRNMLGMQTTYVNRANTNEEVYRRTRVEFSEPERRGHRREFRQLSERHEQNCTRRLLRQG